MIVVLKIWQHPRRFWMTLKGNPMLYWAGVFLTVAVVAGVFGWVGPSNASSEIAQILSALFTGLFVFALVLRALTGKN